MSSEEIKKSGLLPYRIKLTSINKLFRCFGLTLVMAISRNGLGFMFLCRQKDITSSIRIIKNEVKEAQLIQGQL